MVSVNQIIIYPIKSFPGIGVKNAIARQRGFEFDRRWMLVDNDGKFITQREFPDMNLFELKISDSNLVISHPSTSEEFTLNDLEFGTRQEVRVWNDSVTVGAHDGLWLSVISDFVT